MCAERRGDSQKRRKLATYALLLGMLAAGGAFANLLRPKPPPSPTPSIVPPAKAPSRIIVYVIDALRPDHLETYGYGRETAPAIAQLAREGATFTRCFSNTTWTLESVRGLFVGMEGAMYSRARHAAKTPEHLELLPEHFQEVGWATGLVTENVHVTEKFGLAQGFDYIGNASAILGSSDDIPEAAFHMRDATRAHLVEFLAKYAHANFFLYVHTMETHGPLVIPDTVEPFHAVESTPQEDLVGWYDTAIRVADQRFAAFVALLKERGLYDDSLIILTADHGESLISGKSSGTHRGPPLLDRVRIPLVMRCPEMIPAGPVIAQNVQFIDLAPTVLDAAGLAQPAHYQGRSLIRLLTEGADYALDGRPIFTVGQAMNGWGIVQDDSYLLSVKGKTQLIDLSASAGRKQDAAVNDLDVLRLSRLAKSHFSAQRQLFEKFELSQKPTLLGSLRRLFGAGSDSDGLDERPQLDEEDVRALEALGYLQ